MNGVLHCRVRYSQLLGLHEQVGSHPWCQRVLLLTGRPPLPWPARCLRVLPGSQSVRLRAGTRCPQGRLGFIICSGHPVLLCDGG